MPRKRVRRRSRHDTERKHKVWHIVRESIKHIIREKYMSTQFRHFLTGDYRALKKYMTLSELFRFAFYEAIEDIETVPESIKHKVMEERAELLKIAIDRWFQRLEQRLSMKYANHPVKVNLTIPYSDLQDLATLARLAWFGKNIYNAPLMATMIKHLICNSSRIFIRWDGTRNVKVYFAYNTAKLDHIYNAPNTGDNDNITLPMLNIWLFKFEEDWTTILDTLIDQLEDLVNDRMAITRNGKNKAIHTVPVALAMYTDYPQRIRSIVIGLPEITDVSYHCSLYYMPNEGRNIKRKRPHRIYEAKMRRRYRRMEGWI